MMKHRSIMGFLRRFLRDQDGVSSIEIVLAFPVFMLFVLMIIESGMISIRHVMLERGLDLTARDVRIGRLNNPSREDLKRYVCAYSAIIPDCANQLNMEILILDPRSWNNISGEVRCVDRGNPEEADKEANATESNRLVFVRACARIDPFMPTTGLGRVISESSKDDTAAAGSFALVATTSFVAEPREDFSEDGTTSGAGS